MTADIRTNPVTLVALGVLLLALRSPGMPRPEGRTATPVDTVEVVATDRLAFRPDSVVVQVGDVVRWRNAGLIQHSVTADPGRATLPGRVALPSGAEPFDSGLLAEGETFTHRFTTPGRYDYFCMPHEGAGMRGVVIVVDRALSTSSGTPVGDDGVL